MTRPRSLVIAVASIAFAVTFSVVAWSAAQSNSQPEEFNAVAILNNNLGSGAGTVRIVIDRWSTMNERNGLITTLTGKGPDALLKQLRDVRPVGTIRTPDSLAYDLRYAYQAKGEDGGRRIVIATDRPITFWEARNQPRTVDYPFTIIQMQIGADGRGTGTLSYATKIIAKDDVFELENFGTSPIMLTSITAMPRKRD